MTEYKFDNQVAFITGGAGGQGQQHAVGYAENGADVVVTDVRAEQLSKTVELVRAKDQEAMAIEMDVTDESDVENAVEQAIDEFGKINFLVNNAGIWDLAPAIEMEESEWDKMIDVNLKGVWLCAKHIGRHMIERDEGGRIINISSNAGLVGWKNSSHYAASKHGVIGLTKTLALEFAEHGITVNAICPGSVDTNMPTSGIEDAIEEYGKEAVPNYTELHGSLNLFDPEGIEPLEPKEITNACLWLSSSDASFITGISLPVDAGFMAQ